MWWWVPKLRNHFKICNSGLFVFEWEKIKQKKAKFKHLSPTDFFFPRGILPRLSCLNWSYTLWTVCSWEITHNISRRKIKTALYIVFIMIIVAFVNLHQMVKKSLALYLKQPQQYGFKMQQIITKIAKIIKMAI